MVRSIDVMLALLLLLLVACTIHIEADITLPSATPLAQVSPLVTPVAHMPGCDIKGKRGARRDGYALEPDYAYKPGDDRYPMIVMDDANDDRWFCNVLEAETFGFEPYR